MISTRPQQVRRFPIVTFNHGAIRQKRLAQARRLLDAAAMRNEHLHELGESLRRENSAAVIQKPPELLPLVLRQPRKQRASIHV